MIFAGNFFGSVLSVTCTYQADRVNKVTSQDFPSHQVMSDGGSFGLFILALFLPSAQPAKVERTKHHSWLAAFR